MGGSTWTHRSDSAHAALEAIATLAALMTAIGMLEREPALAVRAIPAATGFIGFAVFDAMHAIISTGSQSFVALHDAASLAAAMGFLLAWIPAGRFRSVRFWTRIFPFVIGGGCLVVGLALIVLPLPRLVASRGTFTILANITNLLAAAGFLAAIPAYVREHRQSGRAEPLLLCWMAILLGLAGVAFPFSSLWDEVWWSWHALRLGALLAALLLLRREHLVVVAGLRRALQGREIAEKRLRELNEELETRVHARTEELEDACELARQAAAARERVLAIVSHDLRNPLASIGLRIESLTPVLDQPESHAKAKRHLDGIRHAAERMELLIRDLLDAVSIDSGGLSCQLSSHDPGGLVREAIDAARPAAERQSIDLQADVPALPEVLCDRARVLQVFANLLGNALKYGPHGSSVRITAELRAGKIVFCVADTGPGIPSGSVDHVFDPYWRAEPTGRDGVGLGLYIAKGVVERHGGRIWVESAVGAGTRVKFTLSCAPRPTIADTTPPSAPPAA